MILHVNFIENRAPTLGARSLCSADWIGSAISAGGNLLGGLLGFGGANKTNEMNLKIAREQMKFNSEEAQKNRDWQEDYYKKYSSPTAQAAQYRAGGLNPQLMNVQAGSVASGATAAAGELPSLQNPMDSLGRGVAGAATSAVDTYQRQQQIDSQTSLNSSLENLQDAQKQLSEAEKRLTDTQNETEKQRVEQLRQSVALMVSTFDSNVKKAFEDSEASAWKRLDAEYQARSNGFTYYNILPEQQRVYQQQALNLAAMAYKAYADGDLSYGELSALPKRLAIEQTKAQAQMLTAQNQGSYLKHLSDYVDSQKGEVDRRNKAFDLPIMHNGHLTKAGFGLMYLNYNQNRAALRISLQEPNLIKGRLQLMQDEHSLLGFKKFGMVMNGVSDGTQTVVDAYSKVKGKPNTATKSETYTNRDGSRTKYEWKINDTNNTFTGVYW